MPLPGAYTKGTALSRRRAIPAPRGYPRRAGRARRRSPSSDGPRLLRTRWTGRRRSPRSPTWPRCVGRTTRSGDAGGAAKAARRRPRPLVLARSQRPPTCLACPAGGDHVSSVLVTESVDLRPIASLKPHGTAGGLPGSRGWRRRTSTMAPVASVELVALANGQQWPSSPGELIAVQRVLADLDVEPWQPPDDVTATRVGGATSASNQRARGLAMPVIGGGPPPRFYRVARLSRPSRSPVSRPHRTCRGCWLCARAGCG